MNDIVDQSTRSRMMSGIRGSNTKPEMLVRRALHAAGYRYRLHVRDLPGRPDLVMPKHRIVIFVNGCFWHRHPYCHYTTTPSTRADFWANKFKENRKRDKRNIETLISRGWRVLVVWECGLKHTSETVIGDLIRAIEHTTRTFIEIPAMPPRPRKEQ